MTSAFHPFYSITKLDIQLILMSWLNIPWLLKLIIGACVICGTAANFTSQRKQILGKMVQVQSKQPNLSNQR